MSLNLYQIYGNLLLKRDAVAKNRNMTDFMNKRFLKQKK